MNHNRIICTKCNKVRGECSCSGVSDSTGTAGSIAWLPIETAPKDGTKILVTRFNESFGCWDTGVVKWVEGTWAVVPTRDFRLSLLGSHWTPLPAPPKQ